MTDHGGIDGREGWLMVISAFLATATVFGVAYSFGAFFGPMADEFGSARSETALFFAITTFAYFAFGLVTGRVADRVGPRKVLLFGAVAMVLGLLATSQVGSLWLGYLTYGLGVGIGVACAYVPMVAAVGGWFEQKRTTALGFAVAGIGIGTLVTGPVAERLVEARGWRSAYIVLAIATGVLLSIAAVAARTPPTTTSAPPVPLKESIGSDSRFWLLYGSMLLIAFPLFLPFVFMADYVDQKGIDGSAGLLVGLIGISSVLGRLGLGALASRVSAFALYRGSFIVLALSLLLWMVAGSSYAVLVLFAITLGVAYGGFIALAPAVTAMTFGPVGLGGVLGALYTSAGVGGLFGPPLMGALIDRMGYSSTIIVAACFGLAASGVLLLLPIPAEG